MMMTHYRAGKAAAVLVLMVMAVIVYMFMGGGQEPPIFGEIRLGETQSLKAWLTLENDPDTVSDEGKTALMVAVAYNQVEMVHLLLEAGANINAQNNVGFSPLMIAASKGNAQLCRQLIDAGADLGALDTSGRNPLMLTAVYSEYQTKPGPEWRNYVDVVSLLIEQGAEIDERHPDGRTALIFAAAVGHLGTVQTLIRSGADISATDDQGRSAADWAREYKHTQLLEYLE